MVALVRRLPGEGNLSVRDFVLSAASVSLLYPFVREAFAAVTLRGRFGPVWLNLLTHRRSLRASQPWSPAGPAAPPSDLGSPVPPAKRQVRGQRRRA